MRKFLTKAFLKEFFIYVGFGLFASLVSYGTFYLFYKVVFAYSHVLTANTIAFILGTTFSFLTSKRFVFKNFDWSFPTVRAEIIEFFSLRILTFTLEQLGLYIAGKFIDPTIIYFAYHSFTLNGIMLAKALISIVAGLINYLFSKLIIFKPQ